MKIFNNAIKLGTVAALAAVAVMSAFAGMTAFAAPDKKIYIIDKNGAGDFTTIQAGVDAASDGDTLLIYPGTYTEDVRVADKGLDIVGADRDLCILEYDTASYIHVPLTIGAGKVSNLTIYGMAAKPWQQPLETAGAPLEGPPPGMAFSDWLKNYKGYVVHVDQDFLYGRGLSFENCRIVSENNFCVGIGGRGKASVTFENCSLEAFGEGGCIFMHDPLIKEVSGEMSLSVKNCSLTNYLSPYIMTFWSYMPDLNSTKLTFQNTRVSTVAYAYDAGYVPFNANSFFDVESLMQLEMMGGLGLAGLASPAPKLVYELSPKEASRYMKGLGLLKKGGGVLAAPKGMLAEGIAYLNVPAEGAAMTKHQVIAIYNWDSMPRNGWCGLGNAYLAPDSFGNTLPEMNAPLQSVNNPYTAGVSAGTPSSGH